MPPPRPKLQAQRELEGRRRMIGNTNVARRVPIIGAAVCGRSEAEEARMSETSAGDNPGHH